LSLSARRASCANNLKQWGLVFKMYANESRGNKYPPLKQLGTVGDGSTGTCNQGLSNAGQLITPNATSIYPEYASDPNIWFCPSDTETPDEFLDPSSTGAEGFYKQGVLDPCSFYGASYCYWSYAISPANIFTDPSRINEDITVLLTPGTHDTNFADFVTQLNAATGPIAGFLTASGMVAAGAPGANFDAYEADIELADGTTIRRFAEGMERFFITDINNPAGSAAAQSEIAVMYDLASSVIRPAGGTDTNFNHVPGGGNVLFMDGHVEFQRYPSEFPICRAWSMLLGMLS
jgi:prepilin-type processing-associated H-X9-DG protein